MTRISALRCAPFTLKLSRSSIPSTANVPCSIVTRRGVGVLACRHPANEAIRCQIADYSTSLLRRNLSGAASTRFAPSTSPASSSTPSASSSPAKTEAVKEPRLSLTFTCTAPIATPDVQSSSSDADASSESLPVQKCGHRSTHTFTKRAYEKGIVIIACPSCNNRCVLLTRVFSLFFFFFFFFFLSFLMISPQFCFDNTSTSINFHANDPK
jgi:hypothetical protein